MAYINLGLAVWPIGSLYLSSVSTSPATIFGGTWTALTDGRFLRPSSSYGETGGEATHKLTAAEIPAHKHNLKYRGLAMADGGGSGYTFPVVDEDNATHNTFTDGGDGNAHNNLPPYRTVYCWYRTA